jgi:hypothetical protein
LVWRKYIFSVSLRPVTATLSAFTITTARRTQGKGRLEAVPQLRGSGRGPRVRAKGAEGRAAAAAAAAALERLAGAGVKLLGS